MTEATWPWTSSPIDCVHQMESITFDDQHVRFKKRYGSFAEIPTTDILAIEVSEARAFRHPVAGLVVASVCLVIVAAIIVAAVVHGTGWFVLLVPAVNSKGGLVPFLLFVACYLYWDILSSKTIPWVVILTKRRDYRIPVSDGSLHEVTELIGRIHRSTGTVR